MADGRATSKLFRLAQPCGVAALSVHKVSKECPMPQEIEFTEIESLDDTVICELCGVVVYDANPHREWHQSNAGGQCPENVHEVSKVDLLTDAAAAILVQYSGDGEPEDAPMWVWQALQELTRYANGEDTYA